MKNSTSSIVSLLGGIILGSTVTCLVHHKCKMGKLHKMGGDDIHKKIISGLDELRNIIAAAHPSEELCSCDDPACNCPTK